LHRIIISSNTTSPANDQVVLAPTLKEELENAEELYHELFPYCLCPPPVFFFIIRISYLRREASQAMVLGDDMTNLMFQATQLLSEIDGFSVDDWAQPGDDHNDWLTIGLAYKHAVAVYCIMSLQSLGLIPISLNMSTQLKVHGETLGTHLRVVLATKRLRKFATWPLIVAGAEAGYRDEARRHWIEDCCEDLAHFSGSKCPLNMRGILRTYWDSGLPGWEECFYRPFAFMF
jgi:hypothetical protein